MEHGTVFTVSVAGIGIRFEFPFVGEVPEELRPFLTDETEAPVIYRAELRQRFCPWGKLVSDMPRQKIYRTDEGWLRVYAPQTAVLLTPEGNHTLYLASESVPQFQRGFTVTSLLGAEYVLARHGRLLLHSSVIRVKGKTILFSGPSGIGKSTQADLWRQYAGAEVINGDRGIITRRDGVFYADGSPFCGSSGIRTTLCGPIGALLFLEQGEENQLREISCADAYGRLYSQIITNPWDSDYTRRVCTMIEAMIAGLPMYCYRCRPDRSAVETLKEELTKRQIISQE